MSFNQLISSIVLAGVDYEVGIENRYRRKSINILFLLTIIGTIPYYYLHSYYSLWQPFSVLIFFHVSLIVGLILNYRGKFNYSNIIVIINTNVTIIFMTYYYGFDSGFHLYMYTSPIYIFWIYKLDQVKNIVIDVLIYAFFLCIILFFYSQNIEAVHYTQIHGIDLYALNFVLTYTPLFLLFYNFSEYYHLIAYRLELRQEELMEEVEKRIDSEKYTNTLFEELKESYRNLEQFNFIVSHNLKSPIANIRGFLSLYETSSPQNDNDIIVESVDASVQNLNSILTDLNEILAVNKQNKTYHPVLFKEVMDEVKTLLSSEIKEYGVQIDEAYEPTLKIITVRTLLHSILYNLIQNAIKYRSQERDLQIKISVVTNKLTTLIEVEDNGSGIDLERHRDRLFKLYSRLDLKQPGKGIGLYLVKLNVQNIGGKIELQSELHKGTKFLITLKQNEYYGD
jgi:signal transduction histidine kinase